MTQQKIIVAIDGPAGAGKSTVAKLLAKELHYLYIDTGAMYRALTLKVQRNNINVADEKAICALMHETEIKLLYADGLLTVLLDEKDVSEEIRKPRISNSVSDIAKIPGVRALMTSLQRDYAKNDNCVLEGRDIGTVVFPKAQFKFYIDADFNERTRRRFKELQEKNVSITQQDIEKDLSGRDTIDSTRQCAPLKKADDAIYLDTTHLSIEEVVQTMNSWIKPS